jgi:hypothetical protein
VAYIARHAPTDILVMEDEALLRQVTALVNYSGSVFLPDFEIIPILIYLNLTNPDPLA